MDKKEMIKEQLSKTVYLMLHSHPGHAVVLDCGDGLNPVECTGWVYLGQKRKEYPDNVVRL
jgi:hypothetical protein